jgi:hypothetical protein
MFPKRSSAAAMDIVNNWQNPSLRRFARNQLSATLELVRYQSQSMRHRAVLRMHRSKGIKKTR